MTGSDEAVPRAREGWDALLTDGSLIRIPPAVPDDAVALRALHDRASDVVSVRTQRAVAAKTHALQAGPGRGRRRARRLGSLGGIRIRPRPSARSRPAAHPIVGARATSPSIRAQPTRPRRSSRSGDEAQAESPQSLRRAALSEPEDGLCWYACRRQPLPLQETALRAARSVLGRATTEPTLAAVASRPQSWAAAEIRSSYYR